MAKEIRLFLPFTVPAEDREKSFPKEMEMATILSLVELERGKGRKVEEIVYVTEVYYPLWLSPWKKRSLLFDGFNVHSHKKLYDIVPDIQIFINEVKECAETREAYSEFLSQHLNYFQDFMGKEEKIYEGLITSQDLLNDIVSFLPKAKFRRKPMVHKIVLSPVINAKSVSSSSRELSDLSTRLKKDIKGLSQIMKLLSKTTEKVVRNILREIKKTQKSFDKKIAQVRPLVMKRRREIKRKHDKEVTSVSRTFEQQLRSLHQDLIKVESEIQRLINEIDRCETEIKSSRARKDEAGELQWRKSIQEHKNMISILEKKKDNLNKRINDTNTTKRLELSELKVKYDTQAKNAMEDLREVEASKEAATMISKSEIGSFEDWSSDIINQVNSLLELKESALKEVEETGIPRGRRRNTLLYIPFYLVCYRRDMKKRYVVYPPSIVGRMGLVTKFKGVFGSTKIKALLKERSKSISNLTNQVIVLIDQNPVFEKEVNDAGTQANILQSKESQERIRMGLEKLKSEEWISESEVTLL